MNKMISGTVTALVVSGLLSGCGYSNHQGATGNKPNNMRDVGYYNNQAGQPNRYNENNMTQPVNPNKANENYSSHSQQAMLVRQRVNQLSGIHDAQVLVSKHNVIVGVNTTGPNTNKKAVDQKVKTAVKDVVNNKKVHVTTDTSIVRRMKNVTDRVNNGSAGNEVSSDIRGIVNDLGDVVKRPFQNNSK